MKQIVEEVVRCPQCRRANCTWANDAEPRLSCPTCGASYPTSDGVADLIPELQYTRGRAQALMESPTMAKIYAGKLWRRSYWQGALLGIQFEREAAIILQAAQVDATSRVLDVACASGIFTRLFAEAAHQGRVIGLDLSGPMLKVAAGMNRRQGISNLAYLRGTAQALPFNDACFDCVNCCGALHLFPDPNEALREICRVLVPSGRFTLGTFRKREGMLGRIRQRTARSIGVDMFVPEGVKGVLEALGMTQVRVHHDAARWMILSAVKK